MRLENRFDVDVNDTNKSLDAVPTTANWITSSRSFFSVQYVSSFRCHGNETLYSYNFCMRTFRDRKNSETWKRTLFAFFATLSVWKSIKCLRKSHQSTRRRLHALLRNNQGKQCTKSFFVQSKQQKSRIFLFSSFHITPLDGDFYSWFWPGVSNSEMFSLSTRCYTWSH